MPLIIKADIVVFVVFTMGTRGGTERYLLSRYLPGNSPSHCDRLQLGGGFTLMCHDLVNISRVKIFPTLKLVWPARLILLNECQDVGAGSEAVSRV